MIINVMIIMVIAGIVYTSAMLMISIALRYLIYFYNRNWSSVIMMSVIVISVVVVSVVVMAIIMVSIIAISIVMVAIIMASVVMVHVVVVAIIRTIHSNFIIAINMMRI